MLFDLITLIIFDIVQKLQIIYLYYIGLRTEILNWCATHNTEIHKLKQQ